MPGRVLRQFGYVQTIPPEPIAQRLNREDIVNERTRGLWAALAESFRQWDHHCLREDQRGRRVTVPWECSPDYMDWYIQTSHPKIQNPAHKKAPIRRPNTDVTPRFDVMERIHMVREHLQPYYDAWTRPGDDIPRGEGDQFVRLMHTIVWGGDIQSSSSGAGPSTSHRQGQGSQQWGRHRMG